MLVPRETPYNAIHLENMLRLSRAGAHIIPASPGFYHRPQTIEALVDHLVFRILDHLGVPHSQDTQWQGLPQQSAETGERQRRLNSPMPALLRNVRITLEMIKIEHTLFALPFAFLGAVLAANGLPTMRQIFWITVAMVGARSTAMAFNRIADRDYDAQNPRTQMRAIPAGLLSVGFVWVFTLVSAALFLLAAAMLNRLTLAAGAGRAGQRVALFVHETLDAAFSSVAWLVSCRLRRPGAWIAVRGAFGQSGAAAAFAGSAVVDGGF